MITLWLAGSTPVGTLVSTALGAGQLVMVVFGWLQATVSLPVASDTTLATHIFSPEIGNGAMIVLPTLKMSPIMAGPVWVLCATRSPMVEATLDARRWAIIAWESSTRPQYMMISTGANFKTAVCAKMSWLGANCNSALSIDVRTYADYATTNASNLNTIVPTTMAWNPGTAGSIVLIRAYYSWPLITPLLPTGLQNANGKRIIYAATAFSNEPYSQ